MKIKRVSVSPTEATVVLSPSWLARLFGAKDIVIELEYEYPFWVGKYTRDTLGRMSHSSLIYYALQCQPIERGADRLAKAYQR